LPGALQADELPKGQQRLHQQRGGDGYAVAHAFAGNLGLRLLSAQGAFNGARARRQRMGERFEFECASGRCWRGVSA
jgi:hypothetical protein